MSEELQTTGEKSPKCNPVEKETRINEVVEMLLDYKTYGEICKFLQDKYEISRKTAEVYLKEGRQIVMETIPDAREIVSKHVKLYEKIIRQNFGVDDRTAMISSVNLEKLLKLHNPEVQVNQQFNSINLEGIDIQEVLEAIKELKQKKE
jgi:hypothetical protein